MDLKPLVCSRARSSSSLKMPLFLPVPRKVPRVSKVSDIEKAKIVISTTGSLDRSENREGRPSAVKIAPKVVGRADAASTKLMLSPSFVTPKGIPTMVVATMAIRIPPRTFLTVSTMARTRPIRKTQSTGVLKDAIPGTARAGWVSSGLNWIMPTFRKPRYAMKAPIPPLIASCRDFGMALMIILRTFVTVIRMLSRPQMNTIDIACCQVKPRPKHTV